MTNVMKQNPYKLNDTSSSNNTDIYILHTG